MGIKKFFRNLIISSLVKSRNEIIILQIKKEIKNSDFFKNSKETTLVVYNEFFKEWNLISYKEFKYKLKNILNSDVYDDTEISFKQIKKILDEFN